METTILYHLDNTWSTIIVGNFGLVGKKTFINVSCKHDEVYHQHPQQKWHCGHSMANWYTFLFGQHFFYDKLFKKGYVTLKLFGGINIGLVAVLQLSIQTHKYLYVDFNTLGSKRCPCTNWDVVKPISIIITTWIFGGDTSRHSIGRGENLNDVGPMDMVTVGWPCRGHS
jgi:hypothetical protein